MTKDQWKRIMPLLPPQKPVTGRPAIDHCQVIGGILWKFQTDSPWRDMPECYGKWTTVYKRFQRWKNHEKWGKVTAELQLLAGQHSGCSQACCLC